MFLLGPSPKTFALNLLPTSACDTDAREAAMIKPAVQVFGGRRLNRGWRRAVGGGCWNYAELLQRLWHMCRGTNSGRRHRQASVRLCVQNGNGMQSTALGWHGAALERARGGGVGVGCAPNTQPVWRAAPQCTSVNTARPNGRTQRRNKTPARRFCWSGTKGGGGGGRRGGG